MRVQLSAWASRRPYPVLFGLGLRCHRLPSSDINGHRSRRELGGGFCLVCLGAFLMVAWLLSWLLSWHLPQPCASL